MMKRTVMVSAGLAAVGLAAVVLTGDGRAQGIPGVGGRTPYGVPGLGSAPGSGPKQPWLPTSPPLPGLGAGARKSAQVPDEWRAPQEDPNVNQDILVTPADGAWLILIHSYDEPDAPSLGRALVAELRGPTYKLPAYVWNYGDEERKQELERIRKDVERQKELIRQARLAAGVDGEVAPVKLRVPRMLTRVQVAVLIGGYRDLDAARRDLDRIKELPPLDGKRFHFPEMFIINKGKGEKVAVNPFLKAFPVRNPMAEKQAVARDTVGIEMLRKLNAAESLSLLRCSRPFTLAVKQFQVPTLIQDRAASSGGVLRPQPSVRPGGQRDVAAESAHNLAELLRQGGWEAYVLHTPYFSVVTAGSYDAQDDPRIAHHQDALAKLNAKMSRIEGVPHLFPRAILMPVPR